MNKLLHFSISWRLTHCLCGDTLTQRQHSRAWGKAGLAFLGVKINQACVNFRALKATIGDMCDQSYWNQASEIIHPSLPLLRVAERGSHCLTNLSPNHICSMIHQPPFTERTRSFPSPKLLRASERDKGPHAHYAFSSLALGKISV